MSSHELQMMNYEVWIISASDWIPVIQNKPSDSFLLKSLEITNLKSPTHPDTSMKDFLRAIKLIREFSITLHCSKAYFMRTLAANTRDNGLEIFEAYTSGPAFKGKVGDDRFQIRQRRQGLYSSHQYAVKVKGAVVERNGDTVITLEANGFNWIIGMMWAVFVIAFLGVLISVSLASEFPLFALPIFLIQLVLAILLPYFILRRSVSNAEREFGKEFHFLVRDYKPEN